MAEHAHGRVLAARGDVDGAFAALERARAAFDEVGAPYDAARCVMAQSRLLAHAKKRKTSARTAALDAVARGVLATLGATDLET